MNSTITVLADRLFDGVKFRNEPLRIDIEGETITNIRPATPDDTLDCPTLDARGAFVLPGLINTHTHIARGGMFNPTEPISVPQVVRNLRACLAVGVTTVGEMGCTAGLVHALRSHTANHPDAGPSIIACGPLLTDPNGYPLDWLPKIYAKLGVAMTFTTEAEAKRAVQRVIEMGMDHIKLAIMHLSYAEKPIGVVSEKLARAVVEETHKLGHRVLTHAHTVDDYRVALNAGVDALMHSSFEPLDRDMVSQIRDNGVYVCPTLWVFESVVSGAEGRWDRDSRFTRYVYPRIRREWSSFCDAYAASGDLFPPGIVATGMPKTRAKEAFEAAAQNFMLLHDAGVPIAFGNDSNYGFSLVARPVDELNTMHRAGMSITECLKSATSNAADLLKRKDRGKIEQGKRADIVIVDGDVENDIGAIERVRDVIVAGRLLEIVPMKQALRALQTAGAVIGGMARTAYWSLRG